MNSRNRRKRFGICANLLVVMIVMVSVVFASVVNVDTFDVGTQSLSVTLASTYDSHSVDGGTSGDVIGRYRDAELSWVAGLANRPVYLNIDTGGTTNDLSFSADPDAQASARITWDGDQVPGTLSPTGLNNANLVSSEPANDGIYLVVEFADRTATLKFTGYEDGSNHEYLSYTINQYDKQIDRLDLFYPYTAFDANKTGLGADWSSLGALVLDISGDTALDLTIDYIDSRTGVREYGDLPSSNPNYTAVLDAYHVPKGLTLGANLDTESTYHASSDAKGDDDADYDDEDGVTPTNMSVWFTAYLGFLNVDINGCPSTCYLNGWIDWNRDGDFSDTVGNNNASEHIINNTSRTNGTYSANFPVPNSDVGDGYYYARFRVCVGNTDCDDPGTNTDEAVSNGEVEDYRWYLAPTAVDVTSFTAAWEGQQVLVQWHSSDEVGLKGFNVWRNTQDTGPGQKLNDLPIAPLSPGSLSGNAYAYHDATAVCGLTSSYGDGPAVCSTTYYYWLEELVVGGGSTWYGPARLDPATLQVPPAIRPLPGRPRPGSR